MDYLSIMRIRLHVIISLILLLLVACGQKGPVRPLDSPLPGPVKGVELRQVGESLLLSWQLPEKNLDGSPLKQPPQLDIYRMPYDPKDECPECIDRSTLLASIDPELPTPARRVADRYLFADHKLAVGTGYRYRLVPRVAGGSGQPVIRRQIYQQPVAAPQQLQGVVRDRSVRLSWQPLVPTENETLIGYRVYRRLDGEEPSPAPLNAEPLTETHFEEFSLANGTRYRYRVRALVKRGKQLVEGIASSEVAVTPKAGI